MQPRTRTWHVPRFYRRRDGNDGGESEDQLEEAENDEQSDEKYDENDPSDNLQHGLLSWTTDVQDGNDDRDGVSGDTVRLIAATTKDTVSPERRRVGHTLEELPVGALAL